MKRRLAIARAAAGVAALVWPRLALAHTGADAGNGFLTGFLHPLTGIDHVLAMLAVGMWGAQLGPPALWMLPIAFPLVMSIGGVAGILQLPIPSIEPGIALSVIVLGSCIALDRRPPLWVAGLLVSFFAVFHGYAHGAELPNQAGAVAYSAGFVLATGLIHLTGIGIGFVTHLPNGLRLLRAGGAAISLAGLVLAWQLF
jgi:urease accessory protein